MKISTYQTATSLQFKKFAIGLQLIQSQNKIILHGRKLIDTCLPYFSDYTAGILYRRDLPVNIKAKILTLLGQVFCKKNRN
jgi:hypothetical protein